jgi:hypothetical protein
LFVSFNTKGSTHKDLKKKKKSIAVLDSINLSVSCCGTESFLRAHDLIV